MEAIILPIGSIEQHGPHLPLGTDSYIVKRLSETLAAELKMDLFPVLKYGVSFEHRGFPGTISIRPETLTRTVSEICKNLLGHYRNVVIINSHGGNTTALRSLKIEKTIFIDLFDFLKEILSEIRETDLGGVSHACEVETSLMLYLEPKLVRVEKITDEIVKYVPPLDPQSKEKPPNEWRTINFSKSGVIGDPTKATMEKGEKIFHTLVQKIADSLKKSLKKRMEDEKKEKSKNLEVEK
ncbi:MAG: creatininase family protein [Candidatus Jordarchaeaceae archaeon]